MDDTSRTDGFTLVELLTVILIIGVLAAIATPVLLRERQRAYHAAMASDLHGAILAEHAYGAGHDGYTDTVDELVAEGYRSSAHVTPVHLRLVSGTFVACVKHTAAADWLVYDGGSGETTSSSSDCA
jgi:type IV pilus assembly protein PilA